MSDLLTPAEVAEKLGITERTLLDWRINGNGPQAVYLTARTIRYRPEVVEQWIADQERKREEMT